MDFLKRLFRRKREPDPDRPLVEHPSGEFWDAREALEATVRRLRDLDSWDQWITVCAQGQGGTPEAIHFAEVRLLGDTIDVGAAGLDATGTLEAAGLTSANVKLTQESDVLWNLSGATPSQVAAFLDALFRTQLGVRPFPDEPDDYAVGAEW